jgi:hypothetical protein
MGSIPAVNPATAELLQTLSNLGSPVMSSPAAVSALENAPPGDIVQLSVATTELEGMDAMFGTPDGSTADTGSTLAALENDPLGGSLDPASTASATAADASLFSMLSSAASPADQLGNSQTAEAAEVQGFLDPGSTGSPTGSLFDVLA